MSHANGERAGDDEHEPLLRNNSDSTINVQHDPRITHYCWLLIILIASSYAFTEAPLLWLYESAICRQHYSVHEPSVIGRNGAIPESKCKLDIIQHEIAMVTSRQVQINGLVSFIATFHTVIRSRKFGRKYVLQLNMFSHLCAQGWIYFFLNYPGMPIQLTWISSAFLMVASGPDMRQETIFMVLTDATTTADQLTVFITGQLIVYPFTWAFKNVAAYLMRESIFTPLACGSLLFLAGIGVAHRLLPSGVIGPERLVIHPPEHQGRFLAAERQTIIDIFRFLSLSRTIGFLTSTYLVTTIFSHAMSGSVFLQYVGKQTGMDIADASKLQANSDIMNMVLLILTVVVFGNLNAAVLGKFGGWLGSLLANLIGRARIIDARDITICLGCAASTTAGFFIIGIAHDYVMLLLGLLIYATGQSYRMSARSALNAIIRGLQSDENHTTGLYTIIFWIDLFGGVVNSFALALSFTEGLRLGGIWIGLPFFYGAFMWWLVTIIVFFVRLSIPSKAPDPSGLCPTDASEPSLVSADVTSDISRPQISR